MAIYKHIDKLEKYVSDGLIRVSKHETLDLSIYNYTNKAQNLGLRDEVTKQCRGLILNSEGIIIGRPFKKFFNYGELDDKDKPTGLPLEVLEKKDGSLGIVFFYGNKRQIASRGSFHSTQAQRGERMLLKYDRTMLDITKTYLVEIIYPENRIVVDYGERSELVYLGTVDNNTGKETYDRHKNGFGTTGMYGSKQAKQLLSIDKKNQEGFVLWYENGFKVKIKFESYVKLHRSISFLNSIEIRKAMKEGSIDDLLSIQDDDAKKRIKKIKALVMKNKIAIEMKERELLEFVSDMDERKDQAKKIFESSSHPKIVFALLDGKDIEEMLWQAVVPKKIFFTSLNSGTNEKTNNDEMITSLW